MLDLMQQGGPMLWVLGVISLTAATIFFERMFYLHRVQIKTTDFLKGIFNIVRKGNTVEAVTLCEETPGPVAHMVRVAILEKNRGPEQVQRTMQEVGLSEIPRLEKNLSILLTLAQVCPLVGLLGTVLGMAQILHVIHDKAPLIHAGDLGGGLWQALLSTAAGLVVAIPSHVGHNFLVSRVEAIVLDMERSFTEVTIFFANLKETGT